MRSLVGGTPESRQVAFTVAMIALAAKMAKADGVVTDDEVSVVRRLFEVPDEERGNVARLFNLAKQDVAGFEIYAARLKRLYENDPAQMEDILDGLFIIATADGFVHEGEDAFLQVVSGIFGIDPADYRRIHERHVPPDVADPYVVLGIPRGSPPDVARRAWLRLAAENHPDRLVSRGLPVECLRLANDRMAMINAAYEAIGRERELVD
ncbi:MAG TPA: molecular chaperone DjiA [Methylomirabilota bacterium]|nr:molecular chaperone DjiA [Methylomirabilota bacterium]